MVDRSIGFPIPGLLDEKGRIIKYSAKTHVGAGAYMPTSARGGAHDAADIV